MTGDSRPPVWPTVLVVLGTLSVVALVLVTAGLQSSLRSGSDLAATTPGSTPSAVPTTGPEPTPAPTPSPSATGAATADADATPAEAPESTGVPEGATPAPVTSGVDVLNQTLTEGLGGRAAVVVDQRGWSVEQIGNATLGTPATTVYVPTGLEAVGDAFVATFPEVTRTRPAFEGLAPDRLTLVLAEPDAGTVVAAMESAGAAVS